MKTFGLIVPKGTGRVFEGHVKELLNGYDDLARIILPLLDAWRDIRKRAADPDHQLIGAAAGSVCEASDDDTGDRRCHSGLLRCRD